MEKPKVFERLIIEQKAPQEISEKPAFSEAERRSIEEADGSKRAEIINAVRKPRDRRARIREPLSESEKQEYIAKNLPDYLKNSAGKPTLAVRAISWALKIKNAIAGTKIEGRNNLPKGPYLVVSNHFGGETGKLLGAFEGEPVRIAAGNELNWKRSAFRAWLLKRIGMLPINETLSGLTGDKKEELLKRVKGKAQQKAYREIAERESAGKVTPNNDFFRSALASLLNGDAVAVFPEGLFAYDGKRSLRKGYSGMELLAKKYQELTGQELPIVPAGVGKKDVRIGKPVTLSQRNSEITETDWIMSKLAEQLPEAERGMYLNKTTSSRT